jgi:hypothetical protein
MLKGLYQTISNPKFDIVNYAAFYADKNEHVYVYIFFLTFLE